jgi:hypothetical protein
VKLERKDRTFPETGPHLPPVIQALILIYEREREKVISNDGGGFGGDLAHQR